MVCGSQRVLSLNPTTVMVVLLLGLWLLLGCDKNVRVDLIACFRQWKVTSITNLIGLCNGLSSTCFGNILKSMN